MSSQRRLRSPHARNVVMGLAVSFGLAGCATQNSTPSAPERAPLINAAAARAGQLPAAVEDEQRRRELEERANALSQPSPQAPRPLPPRRNASVPAVRPASGPAAGSVSTPARQPTAQTNAQDTDEERVSLNFVGADLPTVLRVLARFTGRNFLVDPRVKGELTLVSEQPVTPAVALQMLQGALRMQGFAIVEVGEVTRVMPEADAKLQGGRVLDTTGAEASAAGGQGGLVTRTFRLSYESAEAMVQVIRPMVSPNNPVTAYPNNNTVVVTDYVENIDRIARIISRIDTPASLNTDVIRLRNGIAVDIAAMASDLLEGEGNNPNQRIVVVAEPRGNSVVVRASSPERVRLARELIEKLDDSQVEPGNLHVVYLRNARALHLSNVLRGLLTGESGGLGMEMGTGDQAARAALGGGGMNSGIGGAGGGNRSSSGSNTSGSQGSSNSGSQSSGTRTGSGLSGASGSSASGAQTGASGSDMTAFSAGGATVQADATTNTLLIAAPEPVYRGLRKMIDLLDQRRAQVLVESLIVEVTESNAAELGIQWMTGGRRGFFGGANFDGTGFNANASTTIDALPGGLNLGIMNGSITLPGVGEVANLRLLARALQTDGGANILSTPNLLTLDNEKASIMVGQTVPFISGQYVTDGGGGSNNPFQTIEREDIGLMLNIRPQVSEGGTIQLDIYQEVSNIDSAASSNAGGIVTNKRAIETSVLLDDGQIMVLGGLLEDSVTTGVDSVPILGDIPLLGKLFQYDRRQRTKTNLMVFLRPYIIRNAAAGRGLTQDRYDFMRRAQARVQPGQHWALPDMNAPILPPPDVPAAVRGNADYDLRPQSWDKTRELVPPTMQSESQVHQVPSQTQPREEDIVRTRLPQGLAVATDPGTLYGQAKPNVTVLQFGNESSQADAETIAERARISGLKAYTMVGPGGMGYVVRTDVSRDPQAVDTAVQLLRELGYQPELAVEP